MDDVYVKVAKVLGQLAWHSHENEDLFIAGFIYVGLFAFASLAGARFAAAVVGIFALSLIALNWAWLARDSFFKESSTRSSESADARRRVVACLLFALAYILVTACLIFLVGSNEKLAMWTTVGFSGAFACFYAILGSRRRMRD